MRRCASVVSNSQSTWNRERCERCKKRTSPSRWHCRAFLMSVPLLGVWFGCGHGVRLARVVDIRGHVSERILNGQWLTEAVIGVGSGGSRCVRVAQPATCPHPSGTCASAQQQRRSRRAAKVETVEHCVCPGIPRSQRWEAVARLHKL